MTRDFTKNTFTTKKLLWLILVIVGIAVIIVGSHPNIVSPKISPAQQGQKIPCQAETTSSIRDFQNSIGDAPEQTNLAANQPGEKLIIKGSITDTNCHLVNHALVVVWQASADGSSPQALAGKTYTDQHGVYQFETVMPGDYQGRAPHINISVQATEHSPQLTTQLFFPDNIENKTDGSYDDSLMFSVKQSPLGREATYNLVVER